MVLLDDPDVLDDAGDELRRDGVAHQRGHGRRDDGRFDAPGEVFSACAGAALYRRAAVARGRRLRRAALLLPRGRRPRPAAAARRVALRLRARRRPPRRAAAPSASSSAAVDAWVARNTLLLVAKAFPLRWIGPVAYRQLSWIAEAAREGRLGEHLRGLAMALPAAAGDAARAARACGGRRRCRSRRWCPDAAVARAARGRASRERLLTPRSGSPPRCSPRRRSWWGIGPHDEGLMLQAARRIADGQWPYRDFWWNYGPGQPLLLAPFGGLADRVAGRSGSRWTPPSRCSHGGSRGERRGGGLAALLAWLAVAPAMAWPLDARTRTRRRSRSPSAALLAGAAARHGSRRAGGRATLFRPEIGVAAAIGVVLSTERSGRAAPRRRGRRRRARLAAVLRSPPPATSSTRPSASSASRTSSACRSRSTRRGSGSTRTSSSSSTRRSSSSRGAGARRLHPPAARARPAHSSSALAYLLGRTDEFHLVPLAARPADRARRARSGSRVPALVVVAPARAARPRPRRHAAPAGGRGRRRVGGRATRAVLDVDRRPLDLRRAAALRPRHRRQPAALRPRRPAEPDALRRHAARRRDDGEGAARDRATTSNATRPQLLVRWLDPRTAPEDNGSGRSSGVTLLDDYLRTTYRPGGAHRRLRAVRAGTRLTWQGSRVDHDARDGDRVRDRHRDRARRARREAVERHRLHLARRRPLADRPLPGDLRPRARQGATSRSRSTGASPRWSTGSPRCCSRVCCAARAARRSCAAGPPRAEPSADRRSRRTRATIAERAEGDRRRSGPRAAAAVDRRPSPSTNGSPLQNATQVTSASAARIQRGAAPGRRPAGGRGRRARRRGSPTTPRQTAYGPGAAVLAAAGEVRERERRRR